MKLFTIGFSKHSAEDFFNVLTKAGVRRIIDTRLSANSQLSGFAKQNDLSFFLGEIAKIEYVHIAEFAPTKELLTSYRSKEINWNQYEKKFNALIKKRKIETILDDKMLKGSCLLCSEYLPHYCHRRLVAEYLKSRGIITEIIHL